jgi:GDP-4-dehydro-6-deoxy-D-mannose reductase
MKVILVTGSEGFVGSHLITTLGESPYEIVPTCYPPLLPKGSGYVPLDLLNAQATKDVLKVHNPDIVFHLAAISSVAKSFSDPPRAYSTNIIGTANLIEAIKNLEKKVRFIYVSTCEVYGGGDQISETADIVLKNPYAVSKYAAEMVCQHHFSDKLECIILRPFTHTGPGQSQDFVLPTIATQIAEIEKSKRPPLLELGNTDVKREFIDIRDMCDAYALAIEKCEPGCTYNISSNRGYTIRQALDIFARQSRVAFEVKTDPQKMRKVDIPILIGDGSAFAGLTGWKPTVAFEKTIESLLYYWRAKT